MDTSILDDTKKVLGLTADYTAFDDDILMFINGAFSTLNQLGVGPVDGYSISGPEALWNEFDVPNNQLMMARTYIFLKARLSFDPPATSFHLDAIKEQIKELEWRLNVFRETVRIEEEEAV